MLRSAVDCDVLALGRNLRLSAKITRGLIPSPPKNRKPTWRRKTQTVTKHLGSFMWRRDDQAGFTESLGEGQDPAVKATKGQTLAQWNLFPASEGPTDGRAALCGNEAPVTAGNNNQKMQALMKWYLRVCYSMKINSPSGNQDSVRAKYPSLKLPCLQSLCSLKRGWHHLHSQREKMSPGHRVMRASHCPTETRAQERLSPRAGAPPSLALRVEGG